MIVWHLIATMRTERETFEQTAKDIVEADVEEEKRILVEEFGDEVEVPIVNEIYILNHWR